MKRSSRTDYVSHQYHGKKACTKKSRAALKQKHGPQIQTRAEAWGSNTSTMPKTPSSERDPIIIESLGPSTFKTTKQNASIKTYKAVHFDKENVTPEVTPIVSAPAQEQPVIINWPCPEAGTEDHKLHIECVAKDERNNIDGYRVVDIRHVLEWSMRLQADHAKECTCGHVAFIEENREGLSSTLTFQCNMCTKVWHTKTDPEDKLNKSFVWGTLTSGSHYSQAAQLLSSMDIPDMPVDRFRKVETDLGRIWEAHLVEEMEAAGRLEKEAAIAAGHICADGIPYILVYIDGGWCKRSYGHNFNASSGVACIIGAVTKKCLFLGIRNKYCSMCAINKKNNTDKEHECFLNYEGSSSGMEAHILVEGFTKSIEMHGLRYTSFVGDGDSSVFSRLKAQVPYGNLIKKKECKNHVLKNYTSTLYKISGDTKLPLSGRKVVKAKLQNLTAVARLNMRQNDASKIRKDLKNGLLHVLGKHDACEAYYCKWKKSEDSGEPLERDENLVPVMKKHILIWAALETAVENICRKADRLTGDETNNLAENFMSLMAKYTCGKRIHLSRKGSYQRRAQIAGLCQINGQTWQTSALKKALGRSPGIFFKRNIERLAKSAAIRAKINRKRIFKKKQETNKSVPDKDYGPKADDPPPDMTEQEIRIQVQDKLKGLQIETEESKREIQLLTVGQHGNAMYDQLRADRLTASQFGMVCKRRSGTDCTNHVKAILYKTGFANRDTVYGNNLEKVAVRLFEEKENKTVIPSGLYIDMTHGFLGASPDGIVLGESACVEVKTFPSLVRTGQTLAEAATLKKGFCLKHNNGQLELKKNHNFFYQIQGQLYVADLEKCYLVLFIKTEEPITVLTITRDEAFINRMMEKLVIFYKNSVLPEIILRRIPQNQKCIELKPEESLI